VSLLNGNVAGNAPKGKNGLPFVNAFAVLFPNLSIQP
jgi:hypothetical protein